MVGLVPTPGDRADYAADPFGVRSVSWSVASAATGLVTELALQDVADWPTLLFQTPSSGAAANAAVYTFLWCHDPLGNLPIVQDQVVVPVGVGVDVALACKGPYVKVTSASITGAGTHSSGGRFRVGALPAPAYTLPAVLCDEAGSGGAIPAASNRVYTASQVATGTLRLSLSSSVLAVGSISATVTDATGAARQILYADSLTAPFLYNAEAALPPLPLTVTVHNGDAGARAIRMAATVGR